MNSLKGLTRKGLPWLTVTGQSGRGHTRICFSSITLLSSWADPWAWSSACHMPSLHSRHSSFDCTAPVSAHLLRWAGQYSCKRGGQADAELDSQSWAYMLLEGILRHVLEQGLRSREEFLASFFQQLRRVCTGLKNEGDFADSQVTGGSQKDNVSELLLWPQTMECLLFCAPHPQLCQHVLSCLVRTNLHIHRRAFCKASVKSKASEGLWDKTHVKIWMRIAGLAG